MYEFRSRDIQVINKLREPLLTKSSCLQGDEAVSNLKLPPVDLVAMILQVETLNLVTEIDIEGDAIREERSLTETTLSAQMVVEPGSRDTGSLTEVIGSGLRGQCGTSAPPSNGRRSRTTGKKTTPGVQHNIGSATVPRRVHQRRRTANQHCDLHRRDKKRNTAVRFCKKVRKDLMSTAMIKAWLFECLN